MSRDTPYSVSAQSPGLGYISWSNVVVLYDGVERAIPDGFTNKRFAYWLASSPTTLQFSDGYPNLTSADCIVFVNDNGIPYSALDSEVVHGDLIVSGTLGARAIAAGAIRADHIAAGAIDVEHLRAGAITASAIQVGAIYAQHVSANAIIADAIAAGAVTAAKLGVTNLDVDGSANIIRLNAELLYSAATAVTGGSEGFGSIMLSGGPASGKYAHNYFDLTLGKFRVGNLDNYLYYDGAGNLTMRLTSFRISTLNTRLKNTLEISDLGDVDVGLTKPLTLTSAGLGSAKIGVASITDILTLSEASYPARIKSAFGYIDMGPVNASYAHFATDRAKYYFDKEIQIGAGMLSAYSTYDLVLKTANDERVRIESGTGNVAIATTNTAGYRLKVGGGHVWIDEGYEIRFGGVGASIYGHHTNQLLRFFTNNIERAEIDNTGLTVTGLISTGTRYLAAETPANVSEMAHNLKLYDDSTNVYGLGVSSTSLNISAGQTGGRIRLWTAGVERVRIDGSGYVAIGTIDAEAYRLNVYGIVKLHGLGPSPNNYAGWNVAMQIIQAGHAAIRYNDPGNGYYGWQIGMHGSGNAFYITRMTGLTTAGSSVSIDANCYLTAPRVYGAVGNDFADKLDMESDGTEPGYVVSYVNGKQVRTSQRNDQAALGIVSDTNAITAGAQCNRGLSIAVAGFVLAYVDCHYRTGTNLTVGDDGRLTEARSNEKAFASFVDFLPGDEWNSVKVKGRALVKVMG